MKDIETGDPSNDRTTGLDSGPHAAILPLVRLLARQAAREDYERALEAARTKPYSMERARGAPNAIEES
jgi:hypothetical protein